MAGKAFLREERFHFEREKLLALGRGIGSRHQNWQQDSDPYDPRHRKNRESRHYDAIGLRHGIGLKKPPTLRDSIMASGEAYVDFGHIPTGQNAISGRIPPNSGKFD